MKKRKSVKVELLGLAVCLALGWASDVALAEEEDFFPLTLWAIWAPGQYPDTPAEWDAERACLDSIEANRLEGCLNWEAPHEVEILDSLCHNGGYRLTAEIGWVGDSLGNDSAVQFLSYWPKVWAGSLHEWPDSVAAVIQSMYDSLGTDSGLYGYLVAHEGDSTAPLHNPFYWPGFDAVCQMIDSIDPNPDHKSIAIDRIWLIDSTFFDAVPNLDVFEHDSYPFFKDLPYSGQEFQDTLDAWWVVRGYQLCFESFKGRHTEWQNIVQAGAYNEGHPRRRPTEWEIRVQAFLALSRGAKGIGYFSYFSAGDPPDYFYHGLVSEYTPRQPIHDWFDYVADLNQDLRLIGPIIGRLECTAAFDTSNIPPDSYIKSVTGSDYIEIGTFLGAHHAGYSPEDTIIPESPLLSDYFMLVNRHCLPEDTVTLTVEIEKEGTWFCRDMLTGEDTVLVSDPSGRFQYTKVVGPGDGCLVLLKKAKYGVIPRDIWYEYEYIAGDVTVPDTGLIIVEPGTLIKAVAGCDNQSGGVDSTLSEIIVEGRFTADAGWIAGADTIVFTSSADTAQPGNWYGIRFQSNSSGSVRKCAIEYAYCGITAVGADLSPIRQNNVSQNAYAGIVVNNCSPSILDNEISANGVYGIFTHWSSSTIEGNVLYDNERYGIMSWSSKGTISENRALAEQELSTDYGICLRYPTGDFSLVGNYVFGYTQGGIACEGIWAGEIMRDTINLSGYHGLHCSHGSDPVVTQSIITDHDIGVYCEQNSYPILG